MAHRLLIASGCGDGGVIPAIYSWVECALGSLVDAYERVCAIGNFGLEWLGSALRRQSRAEPIYQGNETNNASIQL